MVYRASNLLGRFSLSFWDAKLIAAACEARLQTLYSEDLTAYPEIDGLTLVNPFLD